MFGVLRTKKKTWITWPGNKKEESAALLSQSVSFSRSNTASLLMGNVSIGGKSRGFRFSMAHIFERRKL